MGKEREFLDMSDTESVHYLSSENCPAEIRQKYESFMERHGHRCIREAEFIEKSWRAEPEKLIRVLKVGKSRYVTRVLRVGNSIYVIKVLKEDNARYVRMCM